MADPFDSPDGVHADEAGIKRDRFGRYVIPDPDTGRERAWTRVTTFAKSAADTQALVAWGERMVIAGLMRRPDLQVLARATPVDDRETLNEIAIKAKDAAGANTAAHYGTALHAMTEAVDKGEVDEDLPEPWAARVRAYRAAMEAHKIEILPGMVERIVIVKRFGVAGTFDRIVTSENWPLPRIADLKGLALDTPLPTPTGWTTMDKVQVEDQVLGSDGRPCSVTAKSEIKRIGTYVVRFDDKTEIVCDSEHLWETTTRTGGTAVRSIEDIYGSVHDSRGQAQHRVKVTAPLQLPAADLPVDAYLLGCWLGDGANRGGTITGADQELFSFLEQDGHQLGVEQIDTRRPHVKTRTVLGLMTKLRIEGLLYNKHIPEQYLRSSFDQRLRLLQGLMDTDGTWNKPRRQAVFNGCNENLVDGVVELLLSLGQKPYKAFYRRKGFGLVVDSWTVAFTPNGLNPFRLPRKADQASVSTVPLTRANRRVIVSVEPGPDVETACIAVDSPDHLYLAGPTMIPTHNTGRDLSYAWKEISIQLALYAHADAIYNPSTNSFELMPMVDQEQALVMHLPVEGSACDLYTVDIETGWAAAELCNKVRNWRKYKGLATKIDSVSAEITKDQVVELSWAERIAAAESVDDLTHIWLAARAEGAWTAALEQLGKQRKAEMR